MSSPTLRRLLFFLALAVLMRWPTFFPSVINHDESTYIVIADELLRGEVYLRDVLDTKPLGIFLIYALLIKLTGGAIPLLRLAAALAVGLGGWLLCVINRRVTGRAAAGYLAGGLYCLMCSAFTYFGISPNTELFFVPFSLAAIAVTVAAERKRWAWGGLLLGLGFVIKPFVAAEALAIGLYLLWYYRRAPAHLLASGLLLVGAFLVPVAAVAGYFYAVGEWDRLLFYTFTVNAAYATAPTLLERAVYMGDYLLRYSPLILLGAYARVRGGSGKVPTWWVPYLALLAILVTIVILLTGKPFGHYQIQLHPVVALWVGAVVIDRWPAALRGRAIPVMALAAASVLGIAHYFYYQKKPDRAAEIATYLRPRLGPEETFFTLNDYQITYHLLGRPLPVPYAHPPLMQNPEHVASFRVDQAAVARSVVENASVRYVFIREGDEAIETPLSREVLQHFQPIDTLDGGILIFSRASAPTDR